MGYFEMGYVYQIKRDFVSFRARLAPCLVPRRLFFFFSGTRARALSSIEASERQSRPHAQISRNHFFSPASRTTD